MDIIKMRTNHPSSSPKTKNKAYGICRDPEEREFSGAAEILSS